jgi:hypothetical protein
VRHRARQSVPINITKENAIARTLTKRVARRQDQSFADWCVEIRELAGNIGPGPNALRGLGRRCDAATGALYGGADIAAEGRVTINGAPGTAHVV